MASSSCPEGSKLTAVPLLDYAATPTKSAAASTTEQEDAPMETTAAIDTSASNAEPTPMDEQAVLDRNQNLQINPRYLRYNCWDVAGPAPLDVTTWSENPQLARPLPSPPLLSSDHPVHETVVQNPEVFKIVTPINTPSFRYYLTNHPNPKFVESVCIGLKRGFWPWGLVDKEGYPSTFDNSRATPNDPIKAQFLRDQRDEEIRKGRFSSSFNDLLPGMYASPTFAVPKRDSNKLRLVTDQSDGRFPVNNLTTPHQRAFPMDNMRQLGQLILQSHRQLAPGEKLLLFKSDVSEAYRLIPMHPYWQIKQVNTVDGLHFIDRNNVFGGRRSGDLFISFMALTLWIARNKFDIRDLLSYIDDVFSSNKDSDMEFYHPYQQLMPAKQVKLLRIWDILGIPHRKEKQLWGTKITIIGIEVDTEAMTLTLSAERKKDLLQQLDRFIVRERHPRKCFQLRDFQRMAGWLNWSFNVFPLLRPCLNNLYAKIAPLKRGKAYVIVNKAISKDLEWAEHHIAKSTEVILLREIEWTPNQAESTIFCDASLVGLSFYLPYTNQGFISEVPEGIPAEMNFFREALAVTSAIDHIARSHPSSKLVVFSENQNTVDLFSSLSTRPDYNPLLIYATSLLLDFDIRLKVIHVPGESNHIADALSRRLWQRAIDLSPGITITKFKPPQNALGAYKK